MGTINFWLTFCILPVETKQYPQRLACNAWHLAENPRKQVVGFSGEWVVRGLCAGKQSAGKQRDPQCCLWVDEEGGHPHGWCVMGSKPAPLPHQKLT